MIESTNSRGKIEAIERALASLVRAVIATEERTTKVVPTPSRLDTDRIDGGMFDVLHESRQDTAFRRMAEDPVGIALRWAIRECGESLRKMTGDLAVMRDVLERAAGHHTRSGRCMLIIDRAWDGIGGEWFA